MNGDITTRLLFVIPAFAGFILLLAHLFRTRGPRNGLLLLALTVATGFLKEHSIAAQPHMAEYHFNAIGPQVGGVPLVVLAGWFYAVYIGWCFAEGILANSEEWNNRVFAMLSIALITTVALSLMVETAGTNMGWWTWHKENIEANELWIFNIPKFVLIGWAGMTLKVLLPYFILLLPRYSLKKKIRWIVVFLAVVYVLRIFFHGILFNIFVLALMFTVIAVLPFKNTWRLDPPRRSTS